MGSPLMTMGSTHDLVLLKSTASSLVLVDEAGQRHVVCELDQQTGVFLASTVGHVQREESGRKYAALRSAGVGHHGL